MKLKLALLSLCLLASVQAAIHTSFHDLNVSLPAEWKTAQAFKESKTEFILYENNGHYVSMYATEKDKLNFDTAQVLSKNKRIKSDVVWEEKVLQKITAVGKVSTTTYTVALSTAIPPYQYVITASGTNKALTEKQVSEFFEHVEMNAFDSLTGPDYKGKKYYLGFGDTLSGSMGNEVKYDIKHTNDIFTKEIGGNYIGTTLNGNYQNSTDLKREWDRLKAAMTSDDMYVQYSSGHGSETGLMFGVSYDEIRNNALSYPAKEMVIFIMACHSGGLVESFNKKKDVWKNWQADGRTLFVMSSSTKAETSSTGPGKDPDEANGPSGSAGSAFGHALWKALIGYADGYVDGVKDGYISLDEIEKFTIWKTKKVGGHTPQVTGAYHPQLIMNKVPPKAWLDSLENSTEGMSDEEVLLKVQELDREFRLNQ